MPERVASLTEQRVEPAHDDVIGLEAVVGI
jgi:hypothetical protein